MKDFIPVSLAETSFKQIDSEVALKSCTLDGENYYMIANVNEMRPFFMSIVSDSNHWMFLSSNGAISAGRKNADYALFPYYTDDKITESAENTGCKSIFLVNAGNRNFLWEPFSERYEGLYRINRNLYKNQYGNKIVFEEINHDLQLTFRYQWSSSNLYGFVRKSTLINNADRLVHVSVLDGLQNIMPYGVPCNLQNATSNLVDAYKRSELIKESGLAIIALSAIIVDKAEPSEALKANTVFSLGLKNTTHLLSSLQLDHFRNGNEIEEETDVKGERGAYFVHSDVAILPMAQTEWIIVANVNQTHSAISSISNRIQTDKSLYRDILGNVNDGTRHLVELVASADGLQLTADSLLDTRHFSNTMFNIMRGGVFDFNYQIEKKDFVQYILKANKNVFSSNKQLLEQLESKFDLSVLNTIIEKAGDIDFERLSIEYLPLTFSRRHGDPSRPWNIFSINTQSETDGSKVLDYQGNWRDIFQNWEALAHSYPEFLNGMIFKFLNATTFEGYNPYRVMKDGFDWESIDPDNPWSYIGYWGDHQIIYLLKLLELQEDLHPEKLERYFDKEIFVYANVPYKIKDYTDILANPKDTILFDADLDKIVRCKRKEIGADGALLQDKNGQIVKVTFIEKIIATVLAKMSNFIPEGGIWMNTQRPEWNDANNALVGNGVSMVTLYYLRRFLCFFREVFHSTHIESVSLSIELTGCFERMLKTLEEHAPLLQSKMSDANRKSILDSLAIPASEYRAMVYAKYFSGEKVKISMDNLRRFVDLSQLYLEHSIKANKREDCLYHAYNLMTLTNEKEISISHLSEMLEGQVAVLSSEILSSVEALQLLDALRQSKLYRADQNSYILYPDKELPHFMDKNNIPVEEIKKSAMLESMIERADNRIVEKDIEGHYHFNGNFKNANDLKAVLNALTDQKYDKISEHERILILGIFEKVFNHKSFTGRSGTFYAYEGLGSIYWHMVSKLQLAVQECCWKAIRNNDDKEITDQLVQHYYDINEGIGVHKSPELYGAYPTDPYSHTPKGKGAKQPGMTGQVKEDILSRFGVLGVYVQGGRIGFDLSLLKEEELLTQPRVFRYIDVNLKEKEIQLPNHSLCFTYCQVPVVYRAADDAGLDVRYSNGETKLISEPVLDIATSRAIFERTGQIERVMLNIKI